jgi:hypothetical protein
MARTAKPFVYALAAGFFLVFLRLVALTLELLLPLWESELRRRFDLPETAGQRLLSSAGRFLEGLGSWLGLIPDEGASAARAVAKNSSEEVTAATLALERARCEENAARLRLEAARLEAATATPPPSPSWLRSLAGLVITSLVGTAVSSAVHWGLRSLFLGGEETAARRHRSDLSWQMREQGEALSRQLASDARGSEDTTLRAASQLLEQQLATQRYASATHQGLETLADEQRELAAELGRGLTLVNENLGRLQENLLEALPREPREFPPVPRGVIPAASPPPAPTPPASPPSFPGELAPGNGGGSGVVLGEAAAADGFAAPWQLFCRQALEQLSGAGAGAQGPASAEGALASASELLNPLTALQPLAPLAPLAALALGTGVSLSLALLGGVASELVPELAREGVEENILSKVALSPAPPAPLPPSPSPLLSPPFSPLAGPTPPSPLPPESPELSFPVAGKPRPLQPLELFVGGHCRTLAPSLSFSLAEADAVTARSGALLALGSEELAARLREHRRFSPALATAVEEEVARHRPDAASLRALQPENYNSPGGLKPWLAPLFTFLGQRPLLRKLLFSAGALGVSFTLRTLGSLALNALLPGVGLFPGEPSALEYSTRFLAGPRALTFSPGTPASEVSSGKGAGATEGSEGKGQESLAAEALALLARALVQAGEALARWVGR